MPKAGELLYYDRIGDAARAYAAAKPYSDTDRGRMFMQIGAILELMPPPPARVLECGCGAGWLTKIFARCGYDTLGVDVAPRAIELAQGTPVYADEGAATFEVGDCESLAYAEEFDVVVYFDALHHCIDEQAAIDAAWRALKPGGMLIASETAHGHSVRSRHVAEEYDVTEKDMPPSTVVRLGKRAGFRTSRIYPRADRWGTIHFSRPRENEMWLVRAARWLRPLASLALVTFGKRNHGIAVLTK